ncbi:MAG: hypothetical protein IMF15_08885 [Proteobacteria bacterium]|nr:hypothetical protein [Pseudomonadota bacterium]
MMKKITGLLLLIVLTGCAGKAPVVDNSDKNPTAVYRTKGSIAGFVLPDATFTEAVYTRDDRRLTSTKREYDSWMARQFFGNSNESVILRLDRDLRWTLLDDDGDKTYTECPLAGCAVASMKKFKDQQGKGNGKDQQFDYDPNDKKASACPVQLTQNSFKVTDTGKTRTIAGQQSKEYRADWVVEYKDGKGRKDRNQLKMVFWNAKPSAEMEKVWVVNAKADKAYLKKIKQDNNALAAVIPAEIFASLSVFAGDKVSNSKLAKQIASEMKKVKGHPMSTTVEWYLDRKACVEPQKTKKKTGFDWSNPIDSMSKTASDMASDKAAEMFLPNPNEPIFSYLTEVTEIGERYEHDSIFDVPAGYKRVSKK